MSKILPARSVRASNLVYFGRYEHFRHLAAISLGQVEPVTIARFRRAIRPGDTVIDVGAYLGVFTLAAAECVGPRGRVLAIEPDPITSSCLMRSVAENGFSDRVTVFNVAAGDHDGSALLSQNFDDPSQATLTTPGPFQVEVAVKRVVDLDGAAAATVCKIDVEGAELSVLRGFDEDFGSVADLFIECNPRALSAAGESPASLAEHILNHGFSIVVLDEKKGTTSDWPTDVSDRTYVNLHASRANAVV